MFWRPCHCSKRQILWVRMEYARSCWEYVITFSSIFLSACSHLKTISTYCATSLICTARSMTLCIPTLESCFNFSFQAAYKREEAHVFLSLPTGEKRRSDPILHVSEHAKPFYSAYLLSVCFVLFQLILSRKALLSEVKSACFVFPPTEIIRYHRRWTKKKKLSTFQPIDQPMLLVRESCTFHPKHPVGTRTNSNSNSKREPAALKE